MVTQKRQKNVLFQGLLVLGIITLSVTYTCFADIKWKALEEYDIDVFFNGKFKPEMFWAKNYSLLNNNNAFDRVFYVRHTLDYSMFFDQGLQEYEFSVLSGKIAARNKAIWGDPTSL